MSKQLTLRSSIILNGIGVHSGKPASITLSAAPINYGIRIINPEFPNDEIKIGSTVPMAAPHATVLRAKSWSVSTVEHVMAALYMLEVDNVMLTITGGEAPILDGSSAPFVTAIERVGVMAQDCPKSYIRLKEVVTIKDGDRFVTLKPAADAGLVIDYDAGFDESIWGSAKIKHAITPGYCKQELACARTFGDLKHWPMLKKNGLAHGSSLENTLVLGEDGFINKERFSNECARHKLLDFIGDLMLLGKPLSASIRAYKTGHAFNRSIIDYFITCPESFELVTVD